MPQSPKGPIDANDFIPASDVLQKLHHDAPPGYFTLDWLMGKLQKQSFGLLMLVLAIVADRADKRPYAFDAATSRIVRGRQLRRPRLT